MAIAAAARGLTVDEFLELPDYDRYELVDGEPREDIVSARSVWVGGQALFRLASHVDDNPIAFVLGPDQLFALWPDRPRLLRKPDVSVIPRDLLPDGPPDDNVLIDQFSAVTLPDVSRRALNNPSR